MLWKKGARRMLQANALKEGSPLEGASRRSEGGELLVARRAKSLDSHDWLANIRPAYG